MYGALRAPPSSSSGGLVSFGHHCTALHCTAQFISTVHCTASHLLL